MGNTPNIRFKGFTDDWEQRKLGDVVEFLDTLRKPLEGAKRISGPYPYYGASGIVDYVNGYLFDKELVLLSEDGANITDRNYPVCFLASGKYWVNNHAHVLKTKDGNENNFICNSLERKDYKQYNSGMAMPKLNQEVCKGIPISCPTYDEQKQIGDYFRNLDHLITLHQRKCDETKKLKKFMLQKMFPKKDAKKPEIRFAGFTDDWEQRKLGDDLVSIHTGTNLLGSITNTGMPLIKMGNIQRGYFDTLKVEFLAENEQPDKADIANYGDFFFNTRNTLELVGKGATWMKNSGEYAFNSNIARFELRNLDTIFFNYLYNTDYMTKQIHARAMGTTSVAAIYPRTLDSVEYSAPCMKEQQKIGAYFKQLDHLITLHQRKCDELKEFKKYMLQNMFPQKG